jgi:hypothetical protein
VRQIDYIRQTIERLNAERGGLNETFQKEAQEIDAAIEATILASDKGPQIVGLRMKKEEVRRTLTARAASLSGQVEALTELFNRYHQNPVPPGTIAYGIDVSVLDWETRARVMAGDVETVMMLGGTVTVPDINLESEPESEPEVAVVLPTKRRR